MQNISVGILTVNNKHFYFNQQYKYKKLWNI